MSRLCCRQTQQSLTRSVDIFGEDARMMRRYIHIHICLEPNCHSLAALPFYIFNKKHEHGIWFFSEPSRRPLVASSRWCQVPNRWCAQPVWGRRLSGNVIISNHLKLHNGEEHLYVLSEHLKGQLGPPVSNEKCLFVTFLHIFAQGLGHLPGGHWPPL